MRLNNDSYNYRLPNGTPFSIIRGVRESNTVQSQGQGQGANSTMEKFILHFTHHFHVPEH